MADFLELRASRELSSMVGLGAQQNLLKLIGLSDGMPADTAFARQARRKLVGLTSYGRRPS